MTSLFAVSINFFSRIVDNIQKQRQESPSAAFIFWIAEQIFSLVFCTVALSLGNIISNFYKKQFKEKDITKRVDQYVEDGERMKRHDTVYVEEIVKSGIDKVIVFLKGGYMTEKFYTGGICLYGPGGTGKTSVAGYIAKQADASIIKVATRDLLRGKDEIDAIYKRALKLGRCIIVIDDIHDLALPGCQEEAKLVKNSIMEKAKNARHCIAVIASTNLGPFNEDKQTLFDTSNLEQYEMERLEENNFRFIKDQFTESTTEDPQNWYKFQKDHEGKVEERARILAKAADGLSIREIEAAILKDNITMEKALSLLKKAAEVKAKNAEKFRETEEKLGAENKKMLSVILQKITTVDLDLCKVDQQLRLLFSDLVSSLKTFQENILDRVKHRHVQTTRDVKEAMKAETDALTAVVTECKGKRYRYEMDLAGLDLKETITYWRRFSKQGEATVDVGRV